MKIATMIHPRFKPFRDTDKMITWCQNLEVNYLTITPDEIPGYKEKGYFTLEDLNKYKKKFEDRGINIAVIGMGGAYPMGDTIRKGIDTPPKNLLRMIEASGESGIEMINMFSFSKLGKLMGKWPKDKKERAEQWILAVNYTKTLAEAAEKVHTKLAYHQGWVPDVFWNYKTQKTLLDDVGSHYVGINVCLGCSQLSNDDPTTTIRRLGEKVFHVHVRDIRKTSDQKDYMAKPYDKYETWEGEKYVGALQGKGECDMPRIMDALKDIGYNGILQIEHVPKVELEEYSEIGTAYVIGYLRGLLDNLYF